MSESVLRPPSSLAAGAAFIGLLSAWTLVACVEASSGAEPSSAAGARVGPVTQDPDNEPVVVPPSPAPGPSTIAPSTGDELFDSGLVEVQVIEVARGFTHPLFVTNARDGSGRVFVLEKVGRLRQLDTGVAMLDIRDRVLSPPLIGYEQEQGMLGAAFHPNFRTNGYLFVNYINLQGNTVISRFTLGSGGTFDPSSEKILLGLPQPEPSFNGGMMVFGPDGYLYIGVGTGGIPTVYQFLAANLNSLFGKILRIDVDSGDPYAIPPTNPFVDRGTARPEIWAYGARNPYRFTFDRANGDLYAGGPGHGTKEWVNYVPANLPPGQNLGWPIIEGSVCWGVPTCDRTGILLPVFEYDTYRDGNCVIIGGYVYRGQQSPLLRGSYFYGDHCSGRIWTAARDRQGRWIQTEVARIPPKISSFGEDEAGELYVTDIEGGIVYRITGVPR